MHIINYKKKTFNTINIKHLSFVLNVNKIIHLFTEDKMIDNYETMNEKNILLN